MRFTRSIAHQVRQNEEALRDIAFTGEMWWQEGETFQREDDRYDYFIETMESHMPQFDRNVYDYMEDIIDRWQSQGMQMVRNGVLNKATLRSANPEVYLCIEWAHREERFWQGVIEYKKQLAEEIAEARNRQHLNWVYNQIRQDPFIRVQALA